MIEVLLPALMLPALFALIFLGIPVAFALMATAMLFALPVFGSVAGVQAFRFVSSVGFNYALTAVPLFVFMGAMLERTDIAAKLYHAMRLWFGRLPGGLAVATIAMCAVFAAGSGVVGAVEALVGLMAIRPMMKMGYDKGLISGTICGGGSLGTIIPPSIVVVIYGSIANVSIGRLFAGIILPGLLTVVLFIGYIILRCKLRPQDGPPVPREETDVPLGQKLYITVTALLPALFLVLAVVGSIMAGIASPTEAAGVGALSAIVLALIYRTFSWRALREALVTTVAVSAMILLITVGGVMFTSIFRMNGGAALVTTTIDFFSLTPAGVAILFLVIVFLFGFVLDWISTVLIVAPIFVPLLAAAGIDPVWIGVTVICAIQTSYLTPPFAPSIFYLRAIAPKDITITDMYRGIVPFVVCQLFVIVLVWYFPALATWLPDRLVGF